MEAKDMAMMRDIDSPSRRPGIGWPIAIILITLFLAAFIAALMAADSTDFRDWEANTPYFDGCLPIEVMAERGPETLRHGPMKPRGLTNEHKPQEKAYAVVQLRQDNALGTLYNMVGFQTKLRYGEQQRICC